MRTGNGGMSQITAMCGCPMSRRTGRRTAKATGPGSLFTVGRGSDMSRGAGRLTITAAGFRTARVGRGGRDQFGADIVRSGRRHTFLFLAGAEALASESGLAGRMGRLWLASDR